MYDQNSSVLIHRWASCEIVSLSHVVWVCETKKVHFELALICNQSVDTNQLRARNYGNSLQNISYGARTLNSIVGADHDSGESSRHAKLSMDLRVGPAHLRRKFKTMVKVGSSAGGQLFSVMNFSAYFFALWFIASVGGIRLCLLKWEIVWRRWTAQHYDGGKLPCKFYFFLLREENFPLREKLFERVREFLREFRESKQKQTFVQ